MPIVRMPDGVTARADARRRAAARFAVDRMAGCAHAEQADDGTHSSSDALLLTTPHSMPRFIGLSSLSCEVSFTTIKEAMV
ncbi:hypothetical protein SGPA1_21534 [Streptomyces misionensis JCM 4497]